MMDLVDILKKGQSKKSADEAVSSVLFYQSQECQKAVLEAYRFDGIKEPVIKSNSDELINEHVKKSSLEVVLVELNDSEQIIRDAERISHLLPNSASVIIIGGEDSISTIRALKKLGFYYLLWPISKNELIDFIRVVEKNRLKKAGLSKSRMAKKIAFWGSKGGVGTTAIASQIAYSLCEKKNSSCVIVDHNYFGGNLDILMGLRNFKKKAVMQSDSITNIDGVYAQSLVKKVTSMLSILALESDDMGERDIKEYNNALSKELAINCHFIIEDYSSSANGAADIDYLTKAFDTIVIVLSPTVSSLREATKFQLRIKKQASSAKVLFVLNYTIAEKFATVTQEEIVKYIGQPIDVIFPLDSHLDASLLDKKRLHQSSSPMSSSLKVLTSLLLGEEGKMKSKGLLSRLGLRR